MMCTRNQTFMRALRALVLARAVAVVHDRLLQLLLDESWRPRIITWYLDLTEDATSATAVLGRLRSPPNRPIVCVTVDLNLDVPSLRGTSGHLQKRSVHHSLPNCLHVCLQIACLADSSCRSGCWCCSWSGSRPATYSL